MSDWAGKLVGAIARLAGILHIATDVRVDCQQFPKIISAETLLAAIDIGMYLIPHAQSAYLEMGADPIIADAKYSFAGLMRNT